MIEVARPEIPRPELKPGESLWFFCEQLAIKYGRTPLDVLRKFVEIGERVVKIEEAGGKVTGEVDGKVVRISTFGNAKNPTGL